MTSDYSNSTDCSWGDKKSVIFDQRVNKNPKTSVTYIKLTWKTTDFLQQGELLHISPEPGSWCSHIKVLQFWSIFPGIFTIHGCRAKAQQPWTSGLVLDASWQQKCTRGRRPPGERPAISLNTMINQRATYSSPPAPEKPVNALFTGLHLVWKAVCT